jgi:hypothetical protein
MSSQAQVAEIARDSHTEPLSEEDFLVSMKELRDSFDRRVKEIIEAAG